MAIGDELAEVLRHYLSGVDLKRLPMDHIKVFDALSKCRTAALGGHKDRCNNSDCGHERFSYNSCRNRHCPKCQGVNKESWIIMQEDMLLPVVNYHVVFTMPHELNLLCMYNPREMYDILFKSAWYTLNKLGMDERWIGGQVSATMVLHTWSQTLQLHPHLHCIVPNGGLDKEGKWKYPKRSKNNFLMPVSAMRTVFRGYFMESLISLLNKKVLFIPEDYYVLNGGSYGSWKNKLYSKKWVVYTKKPFGGTKHVIDYLGRYSHRVAITNYRILEFDKENSIVKFKYKDYKDGGKNKEMELGVDEFIRRFRLHILPKGYRKIRQYGLSSNASKKKKIAAARMALGHKHRELLVRAERKQKALDRLGIDFEKCPKCKTGKMEVVKIIASVRPPPRSTTKA